MEQIAIASLTAAQALLVLDGGVDDMPWLRAALGVRRRRGAESGRKKRGMPPAGHFLRIIYTCSISS